MRPFFILLTLLLLSACYRTHYVNFSPENPNRGTTVTVPKSLTGWQSFYLWGWVPGERVIDARSKCGDANNIESIRTRRTFVQGLVAAIAGYYINIYSPWNGEVYCFRPPPQP
jgi:hypothetical protein